jgi:phosphatidylinositol phospholipase C delta
MDKPALNPYVEVSLYFPDWGLYLSPPVSTSALQVSSRTSTVKNNWFNPIWEESLSLPFEVLGDMRELVFVRFAVHEDGDDENGALAVHCVSLACLREGVISRWPALTRVAVDRGLTQRFCFRVPPFAPV